MAHFAWLLRQANQAVMGDVGVPLDGADREQRRRDGDQQARVDPGRDTVGIAASGSHDVILNDTPVPARQVLNWPRSLDAGRMGRESADGLQNRPWSILASSVWRFAICCAATQLGSARRALEEIRQVLTVRKHRLTGARITDQSHVPDKAERAEAAYAMSRRALRSARHDLWQQAANGVDPDRKTLTETRLISVLVTRKCRDIVRNAWT